jgi:hypothetical protein
LRNCPTDGRGRCGDRRGLRGGWDSWLCRRNWGRRRRFCGRGLLGLIHGRLLGFGGGRLPLYSLIALPRIALSRTSARALPTGVNLTLLISRLFGLSLAIDLGLFRRVGLPGGFSLPLLIGG